MNNIFSQQIAQQANNKKYIIHVVLQFQMLFNFINIPL